MTREPAEFICPYCIQPILRTAVIYHCPYYGTGKDGCHNDIRRTTEESRECPGCQCDADQQVCPKCRSDLPDRYAQVSNKMIALVGPTASGKSTYLAVLINELMNKIGAELALTVEYGDDVTMLRYQTEFYDPLFGRSTFVAQTARLSSDVNLRARPLVFRIAQTKRHRSLSRSEARPDRATLVFFDSSGQDATMGADMNRYLRYLKYAAGIIYMVDPIGLPAAAADILPQQGATATTPRSAYLVIQDATKNMRSSAGEALLKAPAAVVLTKTDLLKPAVADVGPLERRLSASGLHRDERDSVKEFVRALFHRWQIPIEDYMNQNYARWDLFGVTSLGRPPLGMEVAPEGIHPKRVADPLLWILSELGLFRGLAR